MFEFADRLQNLSGSIIREILKMSQVANIINFGGGFPAPDSFPAEEIGQITAELLKSKGPEILQYGVTEGYTPLRELVAKRVGEKGIKAALENTIILSGAQQGIDLLAKAFLNKGDYIVVEDPTFLGAVQTFRTYEAQPLPVTMDEEGIETDKLEELFKKYHPKMLYTIPTFQNPTGVTMSLERRKKVAELAAQYQVVVIEDDPYGDLRYSGEVLPPIKSFDEKGYVVYLGTFSKIISPGLRVGFAIAAPEIIGRMTIGKQASDVHTANLAQQIVYNYINANLLDNHVKAIIADYGDKRDLMLQKMKEYFPAEAHVSVADGGLFLWVTLPEKYDATKLLETSVKKGCAFVPGAPFYSMGGGQNTLRLNFSNASREDINNGMRMLGEAIDEFIHHA